MNWNSESIKAFDKEPVIPKKPYVGHTKFKSPDIIFEYTTEEIEIMSKCKTDINLFLQYCKVELSYDDNVLLNDMFNNRYMKYENRINQSIIAVLVTHYLCFETDKTLLLVNQKQELNVNIIETVKRLLIVIPFFMTPGIEICNTGRIVTSNGTRLMAGVLDKNVGIGYTIDYLIMQSWSLEKYNIAYDNLIPMINSMKHSKSLLIIEK